MEVFKVDSLKKVFVHLGIILILFAGLLLFFFYVYLPKATHHDQTITVPKLTGMKVNELELFLKSKNLRFKINDSSYTPGVRAHTVLTQHPLPDSKVKENRMIYVTIASANPPKVAMPALKDLSLKGAQIQLSQLGLSVGPVVNVPGKQDMVYDQLVNGRPVDAGTMIPKGTKITLKVGSSGEEIELPDFTGMDVESARAMAQEKGLRIEVLTPAFTPTDVIRKQKPSADEVSRIRSGETVDVWTE